MEKKWDDERDAEDAPTQYSTDEAWAWSSGYDSGVEAAKAHRYQATAELVEALEGMMANTVNLYSAIANGNAEAGQNFANNDPAYVAARATLAKYRSDGEEG